MSSLVESRQYRTILPLSPRPQDNPLGTFPEWTRTSLPYHGQPNTLQYGPQYTRTQATPQGMPREEAQYSNLREDRAPEVLFEPRYPEAHFETQSSGVSFDSLSSGTQSPHFNSNQGAMQSIELVGVGAQFARNDTRYLHPCNKLHPHPCIQPC